jgi:hypothetical protein
MRDNVAETDRLDGDQGEVKCLDEVVVNRDHINVHNTAERDIDQEAHDDDDE